MPSENQGLSSIGGEEGGKSSSINDSSAAPAWRAGAGVARASPSSARAGPMTAYVYA